MSRNSSNCIGQMQLEFSLCKTKKNETIKYLGVPKAYLMFDDKDSIIIENFKQNFTGVEYIESYEIYTHNVDYFLIFLSMKGLMNEEFLKVFLNINDEMENKKIVGFIIDDDLRNIDKRLELYQYYHDKFIMICDFKKANGSNADIRRCGDIYERCPVVIGDFLDKILKDENNKKICAEDKFELCLQNDGRNGLRILCSKKMDEKNIEEKNYMASKNEYNNCTIVNADQGNQISLAQGDENHVSLKQGIEKEELEIICENIMKNIHGLNEEEKKMFQNMIDEVKRDYNDSQNSKDNKLIKCLKLIVPLLTIANGTPTLFQNLQNLESFLISHIT